MSDLQFSSTLRSMISERTNLMIFEKSITVNPALHLTESVEVKLIHLMLEFT